MLTLRLRQTGPQRMHVFVYEFVTGGGWYSCGDGLPPDSLVHEGAAMANAVSSDLAELSNTHVTLLHDTRFANTATKAVSTNSVSSRFEELAAFKQLATQADWTIVIAPEFSGFLAQRSAIVEKVGGRLLGPSLETIRLTSDKHLTAEFLAKKGIHVPRGLALDPHESFPVDFEYPAVIKPRGGAGSLGVRLVRSADDSVKMTEPSRLEEYCEGEPASVSFLCGPAGNFSLIPCRQHLSDDGCFAYLGGSLPLSQPLADRAVSLATKAIDTLGPLQGYVGVDIVLGGKPERTDDVVVEINPRLTTSYVGLRAAAKSNLAEAMLRIAEGEDASIVFRHQKVQFDAAGQVW